MKNLFLGLMLLVGTSLSYATNSTSLEDYFGTCTVTVTFYDSDGNITGTDVYTSNQTTQAGCDFYAVLVGQLYK